MAILFVQILFFDNMDLITLTGHRMDLKTLQEEKVYYQQQILKDKQYLKELTTNPQLLEKFAREQYQMKKEGEELYVLVPAEGE